MCEVTTQVQTPSGGAHVSTERRPAFASVVAAPEVIAALLLAAGFTLSAVLLPRFLDADYLLDRSTIDMEAGLIAIAMTFVIGAGHIDLSVASILALTCAIVAKLHAVAGVPLLPLVIAAPFIGGLLGAVNGLIVTRIGLPSLIVTLATMAGYRGLTQVLIGDDSIRAPEAFSGFDQVWVAGWVPMPVVVFLFAAVVLSLVLHKTTFGRNVLAIGTNPEAALYAGVPVGRATLGIFVLSGVTSGAAAMMMFSRLKVARWDHAAGMELDVITAVVLGGASIFGGRATVIGSAIALVLIFVLHTAMGLRNISLQIQNGAVGGLLIVAVLLSSGLAGLQGTRKRT
jgi:rhamnose transport system permease protein